MFSPFTRQRRKSSPDKDTDSHVSSPPPSPELGRRRRRMSEPESHSTLLPTTFSSPKKKPPSQLPTFQAGNTCNSFLLGGQFYPGKDKKRKHMRRRTRWYRIFCSSPWRAAITVLLVSYVTLWHVIIPIMHVLLDFGRTLSGGKHGFMVISSLSLPSLEQQRMEAVRLQEERERIQYSSDRRHEERMKVLERIVPDWFHRNDGQKAKVPSSESAPAKAQPPQNEKIPDDSAEADDDEAAHAQHARRDGATRKPRKERRNGEMGAKITERGSRQGGPQKTAANSTGNAVKDKIAADHTDNAVNDNEAKNATGDEAEQPKAAEKTAGDLKSVQRTLENMDTFPLQSSCPSTLPDREIKTTLVIQSSLDRLWILTETCKRWKSPIVLAVHLPHHSPENHPSIVAAKENCSELTIVPYRATQEEQEWEYPVNRLRNMALDAVQTSHVLTIDIDFIPSMFLDELIRSTVLEQQALIDYPELEAMIVPAFERLPPEPCSKENDCSMHLKTNSSFIPQTLNELRSCAMKKECSVFQSSNNWEGHYSTRSESWLKGDWYEATVSNVPNNATGRTAPKRIRTIKCFDSLRYEPYVVLLWCPVSNNSTDHATPVSPYYDERFYGYGKNKIELISQLRFMGYHFSVLPIGFIIHNPHFESVAKQTWNDARANNLHHQMDALYPKFLDELWNKYKNSTKFIVQQCKRLKKKTD